MPMERKLLQNAIAICALCAFIMGFIGFFWEDWLGNRRELSILITSQQKFLSGMMFATSIILCTFIRNPETKVSQLGTITILIISGGIAQISSLSFISFAHLVYSALVFLSLFYSLVIFPALYIWLYRFSKRYNQNVPPHQRKG